MTKPRAVVSASLAERGRPEQWANEQEAAALSGLSPDAFADQVPELESAGFPHISPRTGKRFIEAIIDFWRREHEHPPVRTQERRGQRHLVKAASHDGYSS